MSDILKEKAYEAELVRELCARGWVEGDDEEYDRELALYPRDVIGWLEDTQPKELGKVRGPNNGNADRLLLERLAKTIQEIGTTGVLRNGFKRTPARFEMCAFMPNQGLNPETLERHAKVRCRVVRQVHYSTVSGNSIDVVLFVNGIPVATLELKTDFTQTVQDAIDQYRKDRLPKDPKTAHVEPLLTPKRGAVVHLAVSTDEVHMTTELAGRTTIFLPFNLGDNFGAGNPPNPNGYKTSYLWERILNREAWLDILDRFVHTEKFEEENKGRKEQRERVIFPRYHQWDVTTKLVDAARGEGPGHNYLIQHSAGSGKSNSIMWLAHRLSNLHDAKDKKVFDSVIVVTDRTVLDEQLQQIITQYEHKAGVIKRIGKEGPKSTQLRDALVNRTPIIIVTIQTFPPALKFISEMPSLADSTFAIIADEAHSSQTGEAAKRVRELLGVTEGESEDTEDLEIGAEDILLLQMAKRAQSKNISYFAFTATPKARTLDVFGRLDEMGHKVPFHEYSMKQAIEEGFILDVLQNYTTYEFAYRLATRDEKSGDVVVPKSETAKLIARFMRLHAVMIAQKVEIIVEHFRETVQPLLNGKAKAMIVCDSRKAAVKYKLAVDEYVKNKGYAIRALVAFSGEVTDPEEWPGKSFTESNMNDLRRESIPEAFKGDSYQVLIVAEKFQTGFDQPLLVAMYVDKKLAGINAVQTLSRLNRTYERDGVKKTTTYILDFVNGADDILEAFRPYYKSTYLERPADPDLIHDLQAKLDGYGIYGTDEVERYAIAYIEEEHVGRGAQKQSRLKAILDPIVKRFRDKVAEAKASKNDIELEGTEIFRRNLSSFIRAYGFLSQIYNYGDTDLEKRALFYSGLVRLLHDDKEETIDLSGIIPTHFRKRVSFMGAIDLRGGADSALKPGSEAGTAKARAKTYGPLAEVIALLNEVMGLDAKAEYAIRWLDMYKGKVDEKDSLREQAINNSYQQFVDAGDIEQACKEALLSTQEERLNKNDEENKVVQQITERFFSDRETLEKLVKATSKYAYEHFTEQKSPVTEG